MAIALVQSATASATAGNTATTGSVDTTGASLIVLTAVNFSSTSFTISDSKGNTYTPLTNRVGGSSNTKIFYAANPTVGSGHTFSGVGSYITIVATAWSGVATSSPFHAENGASSASVTNTLATGSVSPNTANDLIVSVLGHRSNANGTIDSSFSEAADLPFVGATRMGNITAYKTTASGAENPTYTVASNWTDASAAIATFKAAAAGSTYSVTADAGAFTLTGNTAGLTKQSLLTAATGAFTLTGNAASLLRHAKLTASPGTFTLTGNDASLTKNLILSADTGTFTLTGNDATLTYTPIGGYTMTAETGTFALTGNTANLLAQHKLTAAAGSFSLTGNSTDLLAHRLLTAGTGTFTLTGNDAALSSTGSSPTFADNEPLALDSIGGKVLFLDTGLLPYWNTSGRPASPQTGQAGFNTETAALEIFDGSDWKTVTLS